MVFQNKSASWKSHRATTRGGATKDSKEYYGKEGSSSPLPNVPVNDQESPNGVWLVLGPHHEDSHIQRSPCSAQGPIEARVSLETPWVSRKSWLESQEELRDTIKRWCLHSSTMVTREDQGVTGGGEETPLSVVRPYGMGVPPSEALDMSGSLHLTIGYLLRIGCEDLESQVGWLR